MDVLRATQSNDQIKLGYVHKSIQAFNPGLVHIIHKFIIYNVLKSYMHINFTILFLIFLLRNIFELYVLLLLYAFKSPAYERSPSLPNLLL